MKFLKYSLYVKMLLIVFLSGFISCKKYVTVDLPYTQFAEENIFSNNDGVIAAIGGIYTTFATPDGFATDQYSNITLMGGLSSDELDGSTYFNGSEPYAFFTNSLLPDNFTIGQQLWTKPYKVIYMCNALLEGLSKSQNIDDSVKNQAMGEAKFMRAFHNFYLLNLYGHIPLVTATDWKTNAALSQSPAAAVYEQIIQDLEEAKGLVSENYQRSSERLYVNKAVVSALLAKVFIYLKDWRRAEEEATAVINNGLYSIEPDLNKVFLINSTETLWQLQPIESYGGTNTQEGMMFILFAEPNYNPFLSEELLSSFENNDQRKVNWINSFSNGSNTWYYPFKYKLNSFAPVTEEYSVVMRLSEVYLIRAEARAQLNNIQGNNSAASDVNVIRERAGLNDATTNVQQEMLDIIYHERQTELFTEWGNRWFDLKRWGLADNVLSAIKGANWQITDTIYPIPKIEIDNNPNIVQNPGYN